MVDADPGGRDRAFALADVRVVPRHFQADVPVTLTSDRSGLVMETDAKVKLRGVQVGGSPPSRAAARPVALKLEIDPDQIKYIPANVEAQIRATTVFGAKFVDLIYPSDPSPQRLAAGAVLESRNVTVEVNTVFQNSSTCSTRSTRPNSTACCPRWPTGSAGRASGSVRPPPTPTGSAALNPRNETDHARTASAEGLQRHLSAAAQDILATLDALSTTSATITEHADAAGCAAAERHRALQQRHRTCSRRTRTT